MADEIRRAAEMVLRDLDRWQLPVNPLRIAEEEGILLAASSYGQGFDARIEYFPEFDRFGIYYQISGSFRTAGRVNFSIAHELGHFYLPEHRRRLQVGNRHNSTSDFGSKDPIEREADRFAAHLLMPQELFIDYVKLHYSGLCTLKNICAIAERLGTSVTSTALRYCDCGIDATMVVVSKQRVVQWSWPSEDMRHLGMWYVKPAIDIPAGSRTAQLYDRRQSGVPDDFVEGPVASHTWFEWPKRDNLWEEALVLGDRVLTYLAQIPA